ncbi:MULTISPECIES: hypothetical protein [unclassified Bacillus (in: firmicutes)]|uniref:hypothetical protein n=1 Tax=unclassified Bacillus (in: firmicutes) TaxID=185979 RepID=UPI000BF4A1C1|nr:MULTISPECIES: hypothetical protein [unclassified Bacillus (in: firmicutes)]PEU18146.1 hypothetical protein CN525_13080 [Bacillus sp. AFS014408]PFW62415.1 hypothetical protein COL20_13290 [Bacillus sp. AFS075034]
MSPSFNMTTNLLNISMITKIKKRVVCSFQSITLLQDEHYNYDVFKFMCDLEITKIYQILQEEQMDKPKNSTVQQNHVNALIEQTNLLHYVVFVAKEEGVISAATKLIMHSFDLYVVHRVTNLSITTLRELAKLHSK